MLYQFLALLVTHWFADFVLQTHWQASNKSKNNEALARHVGVYTLVLAAIVPFVFPANFFVPGLLFVASNGVLHFCTDYITSRITSRLYARQDFHNFFVVIGFDQLIHQFTLAATMLYFLRS